MKLLFIIPWLPYPLNSGGAQAFFNMVDEIRKVHRVSLLLNTWNKEEEANVNALREVWPDVSILNYDHREEQNNEPQGVSFNDELNSLNMASFTKWQCRVMRKWQESLWRKINRRMNKARIHTKTAVKTTDGQTESTVNVTAIVRSRSTIYNKYNGLTKGFISWVEKIAKEDFDLIQVEFYEFLPLIHVLPKDVETVFLHHEIRFIHNENELTVFDEVTPQDTLLLEDEKGREINNLSKFKHIIVLTETDKEILCKLLPGKDIYVSPAITEATKKLTSSSLSFRLAKDMVFMGNSDHMPNLEGLIWFCAEVLPLVKKSHPDYMLYVTGKWDKSSQTTIKSLGQNVTFTGFVDDISSFINGKISVVPIRVGSGMRMKIIDSIVANAPLVTTSKGCEGLPMEDGYNAIIADTSKGLAEGILKLLDNTSLQEQITTNAHHAIVSTLSAEALLKKRLDFYKQFNKE